MEEWEEKTERGEQIKGGSEIAAGGQADIYIDRETERYVDRQIYRQTLTDTEKERNRSKERKKKEQKKH